MVTRPKLIVPDQNARERGAPSPCVRCALFLGNVALLSAVRLLYGAHACLRALLFARARVRARARARALLFARARAGALRCARQALGERRGEVVLHTVLGGRLLEARLLAVGLLRHECLHPLP